MYSYKIGISAEEHDQFAKASDQTNLLQSSNWAKIKDNWDNERLGFYKDGQLVASASVLIKSLPLGFTMLYIPRGPIMDYSDKELVAFVINSLKNSEKPNVPSSSKLTQLCCSNNTKSVKTWKKMQKPLRLSKT